MSIKPDFSTGSKNSDALVALALVHAMLNRQGPPQQAGILNLALESIPVSNNITLDETRKRLQAMLAQLK